MVTIETLRSLALSLENVEELPHFEKTSFRIKKKIFITLDTKSEVACFKLTPEDQSVFNAFDKSAIYPVPNAWGKKGYTYVHLKKVRKDMIKDIMLLSYNLVKGK